MDNMHTNVLLSSQQKRVSPPVCSDAIHNNNNNNNNSNNNSNNDLHQAQRSSHLTARSVIVDRAKSSVDTDRLQGNGSTGCGYQQFSWQHLSAESSAMCLPKLSAEGSAMCLCLVCGAKGDVDHHPGHSVCHVQIIKPS
ncbi:hypothetical protein ACOMHN_051803 [Nucella lapillus]